MSSVLVHAAVFLFVRAKLNEAPPRLDSPGRPDAPLQVSLIRPPAPAPVVQPEPPKPAPEPKKVEPPRKKIVAKPLARHSAPARQAVPQRQPLPVAPAPSSNPPATAAAPADDFMTFTNRNRQKREEAEQAAAQENAAARAAENPSANDIARANIAFQDRRGRGTNGVFQIISMGPRVAQYSFRGWTTDQRRSQNQLIEVDAGFGGNVQLAVVNSMIALIRRYYQGDFNFDSQRLGRVVTLSARLEDTKGLQNFLLNEFFGGQ
ncbi:hypothetical protein [uncultured Herbaspirillum sp.]|uniref:hypothetical protein n=1 Tax=uncultured Herbaspirillum sp. TaxID=160236 RepID=UPI0025825DAC|nr:hypothetical protein [uncultured Herbaspirillum sp.]